MGYIYHKLKKMTDQNLQPEKSTSKSKGWNILSRQHSELVEEKKEKVARIQDAVQTALENKEELADDFVPETAALGIPEQKMRRMSCIVGAKPLIEIPANFPGLGAGLNSDDDENGNDEHEIKLSPSQERLAKAKKLREKMRNKMNDKYNQNDTGEEGLFVKSTAANMRRKSIGLVALDQTAMGNLASFAEAGQNSGTNSNQNQQDNEDNESQENEEEKEIEVPSTSQGIQSFRIQEVYLESAPRGSVIANNVNQTSIEVQAKGTKPVNRKNNQ